MDAWKLVGLVGVFVVGCGTVHNDIPDASGDDDAPPSTFRVGGMVTGLSGGQGLTLQLDGANDLAVDADGMFQFPVDLDPGASYTVSIKVPPSCPQRICTLAAETGTVGDSDVTNVAVTCATPHYRLVSQNWGGQSILLTDDVLALADGATATPRKVAGANTGLVDSEIDSIAFDATRDLLYAPAQSGVGAPDLAIQVFANASTISGNVAPVRRIIVAGETSFNGVDVDPERDRLYVSGTDSLYIFDNASVLTGTVTPAATITLASSGAVSLDRKADRLYVSARATSLHIFDNASQLTSGSTPSRTLQWNAPADFARDIAIDSCRDRLYLGIRNVTAGVNLFVFDSASTLTGNGVSLPALAAAQASVPDNQIMSVKLDSSGHLYLWRDSAVAVRILNTPEALTGTTSVVPDKTISGVVDRGYGLDLMAF